MVQLYLKMMPYHTHLKVIEDSEKMPSIIQYHLVKEILIKCNCYYVIIPWGNDLISSQSHFEYQCQSKMAR
jgi:hypothetical protein